MTFLLKETRAWDWAKIAEIHIESAKILYKNNGNYGVVCFHIEQAIEKYLKGYIVYLTGVLEENHSLLYLIKVVGEYSAKMKKFEGDCPYITSFYIEKIYPGEDPIAATKKDVVNLFKMYNEIIETIGEDMKELNKI